MNATITPNTAYPFNWLAPLRAVRPVIQDKHHGACVPILAAETLPYGDKGRLTIAFVPSDISERQQEQKQVPEEQERKRRRTQWDVPPAP